MDIQRNGRKVPLKILSPLPCSIARLLCWILRRGFVTLKYTKKQAEAKALSSVQDVYQELIADLRADKLAMKKDKEESETRWTTRIEKLENNQQSQDKKIADNEKEIADLKRFKV